MQKLIDEFLIKFRIPTFIILALAISYSTLLYRETETCLYTEVEHADSFFARRTAENPPPLPKEVILVGIDSNTYKELGVPNEMKLPRKFYAELLHKLKLLNVKAVGFDIIMRTRDEDSAANQDFIDALKTLPVVLAESESKSKITRNSKSETVIEQYQPSEIYRSAGAQIASVDWTKDRYGVMRFFPQSKRKVLFSDALAKLWNPHLQYPDSYISLINYYGPKGTIESESFQNVLQAAPEDLLGKFNGRIVLVGDFRTVTIATEKSDSFITPIKSAEQTFGTEIHATMIANMIHNTWIRPLNPKSEDILATVLIIAITFAILLPHPGFSLLFTVMCWFLLDWLSYKFFLNNQFLPLHYVQLLAVRVACLKLLIETYIYIRKNITSLIQSEKLADFLVRFAKRYGGDEMLDRLRLKLNKGEDVKFAVEEKDVLIATYDIVGSSALAIQEGATKAVETESEAHTIIFEEIQKNHGMLKVIVGDAQMATWERAEFPRALEHAVMAFRSSLNRISEMTVKGLGLRLAVTSGLVADGDMECGTRAVYTINGDPMNRNARIEKQAKQFGVANILDQESADSHPEKSLILYLGKVITSEQPEGLRVYTVLESALSLEAKTTWEEVQLAYDRKEWSHTRHLCRTCATLDSQLKGPAKRYLFGAHFYESQPQSVIAALEVTPLRNLEAFEVAWLLKSEKSECAESQLL